MEFGILFTSHPHPAREPYPHREVHARVTAEIQAAETLGDDTAWVAEHHFSNQYGMMPDVFTYLGYLAAKTSRIRLGTAVVVVYLRRADNFPACTMDALSSFCQIRVSAHHVRAA